MPYHTELHLIFIVGLVNVLVNSLPINPIFKNNNAIKGSIYVYPL